MSQLAAILDFSLQTAGLICVVFVTRHLLRLNNRHNPLAHCMPTRDGPGLEFAGLVLLTYFVFQSMLASLMPLSGQRGDAIGSHDWNLLRIADSIARLVASATAAWLLVQYRPSQPQPPNHSKSPLAAICIIAFLASLPICYSQAAAVEWLWSLVKTEVPPHHELLRAMTENEWQGWGMALFVLIAVIVAPISEELFFRGLVLQGFLRLTGLPWLSILCSAVIFGLVHFSQPVSISPIVTLGLILGYVRVRFASIALPIVIHALFNARTMALVLLDPNQVQ